MDKNTRLPSLKTVPGLHLLRYTIYRLDEFQKFDKTKATKDDLILSDTFDGKPRLFEIIVSTDPDVVLLSTAFAKNINLYQFQLEDTSVTFSIADGIWLKKKDPFASYVEIFRFDDPTDLFKPA